MMSRLDRKFFAFHRHNPHVYEILLRLAREAKRKGKLHLGIGMLFEVMRWEMALTTTDPDFKLNNDYRSRYARLLMLNEPGLRGMFRTRTLRS